VSFQQLSISITAQNLASTEFARVASDAGDMASQINSTTNSVSLLGTEFARTGAEASNLSAGAKEGASGLADLGNSAQDTGVKLTTVARGFGAVTGFGSAITVLAGDFGIIDKQTTKWVSTILAAITVVTTFTRLQAVATLLTTGHTATIGLNTTAQTANASSSITLAAAHQIKAAATWIATTAQNALNISQATFLALTGVGIAVIIAAAAAMAYFASQMNRATSSVQNFNGTAAEMPTHARNIQRAGDSASLYRRGIE
jgi:hypothetical protein